jgi:ribosome-binding protein aMBF1 (putative translation factor)
MIPLQVRTQIKRTDVKYTDKLTVDKAIRRARLRKGLTCKQLADALGVAPTTVGAWERSDSRPGETNSRKLEAGLELDVNLRNLPMRGET